MKKTSRRLFLKTTAIAGSGALLIPPNLLANVAQQRRPAGALYTLSQDLVETWGKRLLSLQVRDQQSQDYGGILSPDNQQVPGRSGDTIYPFFYLANYHNDHHYIDAALLLFNWMEKTVSQPDGSWLNEPVKGSWKGTTVFTATALGETYRLYAASMPSPFKRAMEARLKKAGIYIRDNFSMDYGNINYPLSATYCLSLLGTILDEPSFRHKATALAKEAQKFFTAQDHFIFGEGTPYYQPSEKGCYPIDVGYNVEESLPALVQYATFNKDEALLSLLKQSLHTHLAFMLPDGAWDNSWGTRNFKWTYWGSRTSDGCQPAFALMADADPVFYTAALANTQLLKSCTTNGLLYGGPHVAAHRVAPSVHHTFCHIKALVTVLTSGVSKQDPMLAAPLPRAVQSKARFFREIQTWILAKGDYRATVTGYDREYKSYQNGHPTGGALSLLWHSATGPLLAASMNEYQLFEAGNMSVDTDPLSMCLTPRLELRTGEGVFMNICDLHAVMETKEEKDTVTIITSANLVDKDQRLPGQGPIKCQITYALSAHQLVMKYSYDMHGDGQHPRIVLPIISRNGEAVTQVSPAVIEITKETALVRISSNANLIRLPTTNGRVFNYVPGLEAVPLAVEENNVEITIEVITQRPASLKR